MPCEHSLVVVFCGQSHFVDVEMLDVYACHCALCQKWSGGIAMYLEASAQPLMSPDSAEPSPFLPNRGERFFCSGCGCPLWLPLTGSDRYFVPWTLLELNRVDRRRLVYPAARSYARLTACVLETDEGQCRLSGKVEEMDYPCHLAH